MLLLSTLKTPFCHFLKILILVYYFKKTLISTKKKKNPGIILRNEEYH